MGGSIDISNFLKIVVDGAAGAITKAGVIATGVLASDLGGLAAVGVGDALVVNDAQITAGSKVLSSTTASFNTFDATSTPKIVSVDGAGAAGDPLISTIQSVSGGQATLADAASTTVGSAECHFGTDNYALLTAAIAARAPRTGQQVGSLIQLGPGRMMLSQALMLPSGTMLAGAGPSTVVDASASAPIPGGNIYAGLAAVGTLGTFIAPTADVHAGEQEIQVTSSAGVKAGDWIMLSTQGPRGKLHAAIGTSDTTIVVDLTAGTAAFSPCGVIVIGGELIGYTAVSVFGTTATFTVRSVAGATVTGDVNGTTTLSNIVDINNVTRGMFVSGTNIPANTFIVSVNNAAATAVMSNAATGTASGITVSLTLGGRGYQGSLPAAHVINSAVTEFHGAKFRLFEASTVFDRGEPLQVSGVTTTSIMFENPIEDDYPLAYAAGWAPISTVSNVTVRDLVIEHSGSLRPVARTEVGFWGRYVDNLKLIGNQSNYAGFYCIGLDSCTNAVVSANQFRGKAVSDPGNQHTFYAIALYNSCSNVQVVGNGARRCFKLLTTSCNGAGAKLFGQPRYITVTGNDINNSGSAFFARHPGYEFHGGGDHIDFAGNTARGCDSLISVQCADHVNISGGAGGGWYRAGAIISGSHKIRDIRISGLSVAKRTVGTGRTALTAAITDTSAGDTISVASTTGLQDDQTSTSVKNHVLIDSEVIEYGLIDATHLNASQRGRWGTTPATHSNGAVVQPYGSGSAQPISIDLRLCVWAQRAYGQPQTTLSTAAGAADTTLALTDPTGWPTSGVGMIEGTDFSRYDEPEVFSWTGLTGSTLTGVTRKLLGTTAVGHLANVFIQPYEPGVVGLVVEDCTVDMSQGANAINQLGFLPVHNSGFYRNRLTWTGQQAASTFAVETQAGMLNLIDNDIDGFLAGIFAEGNQNKIKGGKISYSQPATSGEAIEPSGTGTTIEGVHWVNTFQGVEDIGVGTRVLRCISDGVALSRVINQSGTGLIARDNLLPGQSLTVTAAATLNLAPVGNYAWHVTGATAITTIPAQADGTEITLLFAAAGQVTDGSNLNLNGNFAPTSAGGALTLICDGANWAEKARVVN